MSTTQKPDALRLAEILDKYALNPLREVASELRRQHARVAELEAQLSAIGAGGVEPLRKRAATAYPTEGVPAQADQCPVAWLATFRPKGVLSLHSVAGVDLEELKRSVPSDSVFKPLYTHPAEGVSAQIETLRAELAEETEAAENWRRLALQFDNHRLQALGHLKAVVNPGAVFDAYKAAKAFLSAPPLDGEEVLAQRIAKLSATTQAQEDALNVERWMGIGKAIERACADLPEETEIIVYLEKGAGTVTLIDRDGNEHENFSYDYGFAGVLNEAIDATLAAQAKNGDTQS